MTSHLKKLHQNAQDPKPSPVLAGIASRLRSSRVNPMITKIKTKTQATVTKTRRVTRRMQREAVCLNEDSQRSLSLNKQQKVAQKKRVLRKRHPKIVKPTNKPAELKTSTAKPTKCKITPQQMRRMITRKRKTLITIQIDSSQSQFHQKVSINPSINPPIIKQLRSGKRLPNQVEPHVFVNPENSSESQSLEMVELISLSETIRLENSPMEMQNLLDVQFIDIEESIQEQPQQVAQLLPSNMQEAYQSNSIEEVRESMVNQANHPRFVVPFISQIPNQSHQPPIPVFPQPSYASNQHPPVPNNFIPIILSQNFPAPDLQRSLSQPNFNETIVIEDSNDEQNDDEIQNNKLWFLHKNKEYKVSQLTIEQLEKCDKCIICHQSFILSSQKVQQRMSKTQHRIKVQFIHRAFHQMVDQSEQHKQPKTQIIQLFCNHFYHKQCITQWLLGKKPICPFCRKDYRRHQAYHEFDPNYLTRLNPSNANPEPLLFDQWIQDFMQMHDIYYVNYDIEEINRNEVQLPQESASESHSDAGDVFEVPREFVEGRKREVEYRLPGWGRRSD